MAIVAYSLKPLVRINMRYVAIYCSFTNINNPGFEQTVLQIMSIIRGEKIAGLKPKNDTTSAKNSNNAKGRALNLQQRWEQQSQAQTKKCVAADDLVFLMCSATLNRAVKSLALPLLGNNSGGTGKGANKGFLVVDADASTVDTIRYVLCILFMGFINFLFCSEFWCIAPLSMTAAQYTLQY